MIIIAIVYDVIDRFAMVSLESMACGAPVVALKGVGINEEIVNGETGFLVNDFQEFIEKITFLLNNSKLRFEMGLKGVNRAKKFSAKRFIKEVEEIIFFRHIKWGSCRSHKIFL